MQSVTLKHIGDNLGVSKRLVSYALNGTGRVGSATRLRILEEAARLGYRPNRAARALTTGRSGLIALCLSARATIYGDELTRAIEEKVRLSGFDLIVSRMNDDFETNPDLLPRGLSQVDGAFLLEPPKLPSPVEKAILHNVVIVGVRHHDDPSDYDVVRVDLAPAAAEAARAILRCKPRRFAYFTAYAWASSTESRMAAYLSAVDSIGQEPIFIRLPHHVQLVEDAAAMFETYVASNPVPDALMCSNDEVATGALRAIHKLGIRCPDEIVVTGCDGLFYTRDLHPPLSTIAQPFARMAELGWNMLERRLSNSDEPHRVHVVPAEFISRASTGG